MHIAKEANLKSLFTSGFQYMTFLKNNENSKEISDCRGLVPGEGKMNR